MSYVFCHNCRTAGVNFPDNYTCGNCMKTDNLVDIPEPIKKISKLRDILEAVYDNGANMVERRTTVNYAYHGIQDMLKNLIGEDETLTSTTEYDKPKWIEQENNITLGANNLRAELRRKLENI